jgi:DsbC/DsbD-like thiol-disulfide interchange protein
MKQGRSMRSVFVTAAILAGAALPASAAVGEWAGDGEARVRLLAAGVGADGDLSAAIEIELAPGWKTYWRTPGDSGIAPIIDFSGSTNIGPVEISFPVPHRVDDGYSTTNVYEDRVVLPLTARVVDPSKPIELVLKLDVGVCEKVCIPDHFEAELSLAAGAADSTATEVIAAARKDLPGAPEPGVFAVDRASHAGGSDRKPVVDITAVVPDAKTAEVFVEGPPDWYADVPKLVSEEGGQSVFRVTFDRLGSKTPIAGTSLRVTIVSGERTIEETVSLD